MSMTMRIGAGAILLALSTSGVSACTSAADVAAQPEPRPACEVALPPAWEQAFTNSGVATGGSTSAQAVGPAGEIAAVRDNGPTRDLLLIAPDRAITKIYTVPNPDRNDVDFMTLSDVTMNDRWIVIGVSREFGEHGGRPYVKDGHAWADNRTGRRLNRIDVLDRKDDSVRTIVTEADLRSEGEALDSIALYGDTVYWLARIREPYLRDGILRSYDLNTNAVEDVASGGGIFTVRATPAGITWFAPDTVVRNLAPLPPAIAGVPGIDEDQSTLVGDGTNYAWITGLAQGGTGIAWWSPDTGLAYLTTSTLFEKGHVPSYPPPIYVDWPYVMISQRLDHYGTSAIVDTRSGAITDLNMSVAGAGGGTIATQSNAAGDAPFMPLIAGLVRTDALPPLSC